jgi:ribonuclease BN (tRNA processing enzyme)
MRFLLIIVLLALPFTSDLWATESCACDKLKIAVQVLGSGGPELSKDRASSGYLLWVNDKAVVLIDAGAGTSMRFAQADAQWRDLQAVLFSHFHADHSNDFAALIKASWFADKRGDLPVFGPYGNELMPATSQYLTSLFGQQSGAYKYLSDFYDNETEFADYRLIAHDIADKDETQLIYQQDRLSISAHQVKHGPIPAFAYIIQICGKTVVFSGDTNGQGFESLKLAKTDLFIAHNAIPTNAGRIARSLHMTPAKIGEIAKNINTQKLVLSHRMNRSLGKEAQSKEEIEKNYKGEMIFVNDLELFQIQ